MYRARWTLVQHGFTAHHDAAALALCALYCVPAKYSAELQLGVTELLSLRS